MTDTKPEDDPPVTPEQETESEPAEIADLEVAKEDDLYVYFSQGTVTIKDREGVTPPDPLELLEEDEDTGTTSSGESAGADGVS